MTSRVLVCVCTAVGRPGGRVHVVVGAMDFNFGQHDALAHVQVPSPSLFSAFSHLRAFPLSSGSDRAQLVIVVTGAQ